MEAKVGNEPEREANRPTATRLGRFDTVLDDLQDKVLIRDKLEEPTEPVRWEGIFDSKRWAENDRSQRTSYGKIKFLYVLF